MIMNCRRGIPDEAISPWLLIFWTIGDTSNMIGAVLTKQLLLQIVMAGYAIFCDIILVGQFTFAVLYKRWKENGDFVRIGSQEDLRNGNEEFVDSVNINSQYVDTSNQQPVSKVVTKTTGAGLFCISVFFLHFMYSPITSVESNYVGRTLLSSTLGSNYKPFLKDYKEIFGYILGCFSSLFYSSGRIPQIFMNYRRKCTDGLSLGLFICAVFGNATYGAQILLVSTDRDYILKHLPWIIGSWGVMFLDFVILIQFFIYRRTVEYFYHSFENDSEDDGDRRDHI